MRGISQEHSATAGSLSVVLQTVRMEIDDDDEDIVEVMLNLTNESAIPIGGISANIKTSLGTTVEPTEGCLELFRSLKTKNIFIGLNTGFYRKVTNIILKNLGWDLGRFGGSKIP